jgi:hypothetical protein
VEAILMPYGHVHDAAHHRCCCCGSHVSLLGVSGMTSVSNSNKAARAKQEMYSMYLHVQQSGSVFIAAGKQEIGHIPVYRRACLHVRVQCNTRLTKASISNRTPLVPGPLATYQHEAHESRIGLISSGQGVYHTFPCNTFAIHWPMAALPISGPVWMVQTVKERDICILPRIILVRLLDVLNSMPYVPCAG